MAIKRYKNSNEPADTTDLSDESVLKLQAILIKEGHDFTLEETKAIGNDLVDFFKILAGGRKVTKGGLKNIKKKA